MLIDDDEINNFVNSKLISITHPEIQVDTFQHAKSALEKLQSGYLPDIILLDLNMPELNGWEFINEFKKLNLKIPIYILTSSIDHFDWKKSRQYAEVIDFIDKPLSRIKIQKIVSSSENLVRQ